MDATRFSQQKTGSLLKVITEDGPDHAFVPDSLPPKWEVPKHLWPLIVEARTQLGRLDEKGNRKPNPSLLLEPLQKREALRSSSIEGTYATAKELLLFELSKKPLQGDEAVREVSNYEDALKFGVQNLKDAKQGLPLSRRLIQELHRILMRDVRGHDGYAGEFRNKYVYVGSGQRYVPPPPGQALIDAMNNLEMFIHEKTPTMDLLVKSYVIHYQFEAIHPFRDGNGRVGRLLLALTTWFWCDMKLPWLYMSAYFERFKSEYVDNMFRVSTDGDWEKWIEFCLKGTIAQAKDAMRKLDALDKFEEEMKGKLGDRPRMTHIIERLFHRPLFDASIVAGWFDGVSLPTIRRDIDVLVEAGFVQHLQGFRPKMFFCPRILMIAYNEGAEQKGPVKEPLTLEVSSSSNHSEGGKETPEG
jgi:Fic family protein